MPPTTPITFRCPNNIIEEIDRIGRDRHPRTGEEGGTAKIDYDRTAALLDILNAGIAAIDSGYAPTTVRGTDPQSLDDVKQLIRQQLDALFPELLERHVEAIMGK